jgi:thiol:disulfide interchange protein
MVRRTLSLVVPLLLASAGAARAQDPIHWSIAPVEAKPAPAGKTFVVNVSAEIEAGWHLYALEEPPGPTPTLISIPKTSPYALDGDIGSPAPTRVFDANFGVETAFFESHATFTVPVRVTSGAGRAPLTVEVVYQTCNDRLCLPPKLERLVLPIGPGGGGARTAVLSKEDGTAAPQGPLPATVQAVAAASAPVAIAVKVPDMSTGSTTTSTLATYIGLAALMGALSLLTPCVFPMVPITVSYFTNRVARRRRDALIQALVYGAGIVLTFTAVGVAIAVGFGASGLNRFAANPWLNLGVTALFVAFALSLFGVYELALPSSVLSVVTKADSGQGRYVGTLLMGLAFTLTSFTCTAPFLGTLLVLASQGQWQWPLAGMLAFSSVFALPFVVLALAPQLVSSWPRSGAWLVAVKASMGLLELAAALKFLSNVDLVWGWGIFTRTTVLVVWVVIAFVLVMYLLGAFKLGHAPKLSRPGIGRAVPVVACGLLTVWLGAGLEGRRLGELEAFLPPADLASTTMSGDLPWIMNDFDAGLAQAKREHRPMLVDFTGYTCTNCRWMEANMFPRPDVARELARYVRVRLYTDGQGERYRSFQRLEQDLLGTVALPYYAAFTPDGSPVVAFGGLTRQPEEYMAFLRRGLQ